MGIKRHKPEEIVTKLRQVEVLAGQGMARVDAIRQISITEQTYYSWPKQYGGMGADQLKELRRLNKENERLRRAVFDLTLDKLILTQASRGN
jgi:putative transposase|tara:strand:- start:30 stop:305 length:276 start_codon:yes stop_codon:yes gene_type:complete